MRFKKLAISVCAIVVLATSSTAHAAYVFGLSDFNTNNALIVQTTTGTYTVSNSDSGWWANNNYSSAHHSSNKNYIAQSFNGGIINDFFTFNLGLANMSGTILSAGFRVYSYGIDSAQEFSLWDVGTSIGMLTADYLTQDSTSDAVVADLGSGINYGAINLVGNEDNQFINIAFNAAGIAALNAARDGLFAIGGTIAPEPPSTPVSEPGTLALLGLGLLAITHRRRKLLPA